MASPDPQIAAVCVGHAAIPVPDAVAEDVVLEAVGPTQSGQNVTEMLPMALVKVSGMAVDEIATNELVVGTIVAVVDASAGGLDELIPAELLATGAELGTVAAGLDASGELIAGTEELAARELLVAVVDLRTIVPELDASEVAIVEVGRAELLGAVELPAAAIVDDGNTTVAGLQALLTELVGAFGEPR